MWIGNSRREKWLINPLTEHFDNWVWTLKWQWDTFPPFAWRISSIELSGLIAETSMKLASSKRESIKVKKCTYSLTQKFHLLVFYPLRIILTHAKWGRYKDVSPILVKWNNCKDPYSHPMEEWWSKLMNINGKASENICAPNLSVSLMTSMGFFSE